MNTSRLITLTIIALTNPAFAQSNVSPANKFTWNENCGWMNWRDANSGLQGARHNGRFFSGFIWNENVGWINLGNGVALPAIAYAPQASQTNLNFGVNINITTGALSGFAWGENIGWINFGAGPDPARIETTGRLNGFAWSENTGWINLSVATAGQFGSLCYANCDGSTAAPILNPNDFQCFLNAFAAGSAYANCDGSSANPILNANDFQCFLNKYAAGCP
jgi:hypothetical protein